MALAKGSAAYYNGLDKKYDSGTSSRQWQTHTSTRMRPWNGIRKRRVFFAIILVGLIYLFIKNMPNDVLPAGDRIDPLTGLTRGRMPGRPPSSSSLDDGQLYEGPVKFRALANTLRRHAYRSLDPKGNVVFVLHDLHSAASLTALACETGLHNRTNVHMLLACPQEDTLQEIVDLAGIQQEECPVYWHDARTDYNSQSSLAQRGMALQSALGHVQRFLRPKVVLVDQQQARHSQFTAALKARLDQSWTPLVVLPDNALTTMSWVTTLDATGLSILNQHQIDIHITPYRSSSGSLIRLLQSIQSAAYVGLPLPRITVELPADIDSFALRFLEYFRWPSEVPTSLNKLILRKRLAKHTSPAALAVQTMESFYPPAYPLSHVLLLDPDVELSSDYLTHLHYLAMEYKYSSKGQNIASLLMGISLDVAEPPLQKDPASKPFILSQNPTSAATLYFGDKWVELQNYLALRLQHDPNLTKKVSDTSTTEHPATSEQHSSFITQAAELMRARNYYILHPTFSTTDPTTRLMTTHTESHQQSPEDFEIPQPEISADDLQIPPPNLDPSVILSIEDTYHPLKTNHHSRPDLSSGGYISSLLQYSGYDGLPPGDSIPIFDHAGRQVDWVESMVAANEYADQVSLQVGGCKHLSDRDVMKEGIERLFCES